MRTTYRISATLICAMVGLAAAIALHGNTLAAEAEKPPGDKPFFEMRDEEVLTCTIAVAMDGSVLLFEEQREKGTTEVKRSEDGGKTWGPEIEVGKRVKIDGDMSDDGRYKGDHVAFSGLGNVIVDENTGHIMVFASNLKPAQIVYRSRDHGKTWKTEDIVIKPDKNGWLSATTCASDPGITLRYGPKKGRLLMPTRVFVEYLNKGKGKKVFDKLYSNALYSDDGGKTWIPSAPFPLGGTGEAGLAELRDGRIYYNSRTHIRPGNRRIAHSNDAGETWQDEHEDDELWDGPPDVYGCKAGLLRLPYDDRDVLVFSTPGRRDIREDITVHVSLDGGETWPVKRLVRKGPGNYTWLAAGRKGTPSEGMIYLVAGKDWMARFNLAWIMEGNTGASAPKPPAATQGENPGTQDDVGENEAVMPREKYLLLDRRLIEKVENARLTVGTVKMHPANPLFGEALPWETDTSHMYPNVLFDREEKLYKCWYFTRIKEWGSEITPGSLASKETGQGNLATLYAVSRDGIKWQKPGLDVYRYRDQPTNIVLLRDHGTGVFKDPRDPDPNRRYKLITGRMPHGSIDVAFSADGIRWSKRRFVAHARGDTHNNAFWAPSLNRYVAMTREYPDGIRTVVRMESEDFRDWTKPEEVLRGPREAQTYSMPVFSYAGVYLGLPAIYRIGSDRRVHTELAWSPDTRTWHRIDAGTPLIPLAEETDSFQWGCIYAAASPVLLQDEIRIYYSGQTGPHGWQPGRLCLATLRPDGWAGYEPIDDSQPTTVHTRPLICSGKTLQVTADAQGGAVTVAAVGRDGKELAESKPLTGSVTAAEVQWPHGFDPASLTGQSVRLRFKLRTAKVYSFAFGRREPR